MKQTLFLLGILVIMVVIGNSKKFNDKDIKQFLCKLTGLALLNIHITIEAEVQVIIDLMKIQVSRSADCCIL